MKFVWTVGSILLILTASACGNGGKINFHEDGSEEDGTVTKSAGFNIVSASQALMVESGKTPATGYHAKVQLNPQSGTKITGGGHTAKIKYTTRTR